MATVKENEEAIKALTDQFTAFQKTANAEHEELKNINDAQSKEFTEFKEAATTEHAAMNVLNATQTEEINALKKSSGEGGGEGTAVLEAKIAAIEGQLENLGSEDDGTGTSINVAKELSIVKEDVRLLKAAVDVLPAQQGASRAPTTVVVPSASFDVGSKSYKWRVGSFRMNGTTYIASKVMANTEKLAELVEKMPTLFTEVAKAK